MKNSTKLLLYNFLFFLLLISITESILGSWFKSDSFGSTIRNGRLKDKLYEVVHNDKNYVFRYKKNYYGFRGEEIDPKNIKIFFLGGSHGNEKYTPEELTIVGRLNSFFINDDYNKIKIYNASQDGFSSQGYKKFFTKFYPKIKNFNPKKMILYIGLRDGILCKNFVINKEGYDQFQSKQVWDDLVEINKTKRIKDYIKNNSFFVGKIKIIQFKYFNKENQIIETVASQKRKSYVYTQNTKKYMNFLEAKKFYSEIEMEKKYSSCKQSFLNNLNEILLFSKKNEIKILLINNINYKGVNDDWLFYINLLIADFAKKNSLPFINLAKIKNISISDFYDDNHTTPEGSDKIAKFIYPEVANFLKTNE